MLGLNVVVALVILTRVVEVYLHIVETYFVVGPHAAVELTEQILEVALHLELQHFFWLERRIHELHLRVRVIKLCLLLLQGMLSASSQFLAPSAFLSNLLNDCLVFLCWFSETFERKGLVDRAEVSLEGLE